MRKLLGLILIVLMLIPAMPTFAQDEDAPCAGVFLVDGRVRATVSPTGATYGLLVNLTDDTLMLTGGSAENVEAIEIHNMSVSDDDVMVMRPVEGALEIPAGHAAEFAPGGLHVMMIGLGDMLMAGDEFALSLNFEDGSEFPLTLPIVDIEATMDHETESSEHSEHGSDATPESSEHNGHGSDATPESPEHSGHDMMMDHEAKPVVAMGECEGLTGVMVMSHMDMHGVYDLTFIFEDGEEWTVSVPIIGMDMDD
jgi:periplasmic copper chaperone A